MKRKTLFLFFALCLLFAGTEAVAADRDDVQKPLPKYRLDKVREYDPRTPFMLPYSITASGGAHPPTTGVVDPPPEFQWSAGVLLRWDLYWKQVVVDITVAAADAANESKVYMVVTNAAQEASATADLIAAGADINQVEFIYQQNNALWLRDYGPHFIWHDDTVGVVNSLYYYSRPLDNSTPVTVAREWDLPLYDIPLHYEGGNFLSTSNGHGYCTNIIMNENPEYTQVEIVDLFLEYQGVDTLHIFPAFPSSIDATGHIDMWMCIVDDDKVIIGEYDHPSPTYQAKVITENAVTYMQNLGFTVYRTPAVNSGTNGYNGIHYTYTNAIPLNNKILVPTYGFAGADALALAAYQAALPSHTVVGIYSKDIIPAAGALHCISMQVPKYVDALPSVKVLSPNGGEIWAAEEPRDIRWAAEDDEEVTSVDIHCSMDGGVTFPYTIATGETHDGLFEGWVPPWKSSKDCVVKVTAHDGNLNATSDDSDAMYDHNFLEVTHYDFSSGAGVDKWAYGYYTDSWDQDLENNRLPAECSTEVDQLDPNAYTKLATSDNVRYASQNPGSGNESTMIAVFKIKEMPRFVHSLEFLYEGYATSCQHVEIYAWDYATGNWGDGLGEYSNNNFMDNGSYQLDDRTMTGGIFEDPQRYISSDGEVTLLIYTDKANYVTFHDYLRLTVQSMPFEAKGKSM